MSGNSLHARVERAFGSWGRFVVRRRWAVIAASLLFTVALVSGLSRMTADFSSDNYLLAGDTTLQVFEAFRARYGRDDRLMVGIEPPEVFDLGFLNRLRAFHAEVESDVPYLEEVLSLVNARNTRGEVDELVVEDLMQDWAGDEAALATFRQRVLANPLYRNSFISRDHAFTALVIKPDTYSSGVGSEAEDEFDSFDEDGGLEEPEYMTKAEEAELIAALRVVMARHEAPDFRLHLVGVEVMANRLLGIATADAGVFVSLSISFIALLLFLLFRRITGAILPLLVVALSVLATLGAMAYLGLPFTAVTQVLPSFLIAVGICDAVHILAIVYRRLAAGDERGDAIAYAIEHSGLAVVMTSLTTAAGLASFLAAEIAPVAQLGVISPIGVILALVYTLTLLPALLAVTPVAARQSGDRGVAGVVDAALARLARVATRYPRAVLALTAAVLLAGVSGVREVRFSNDSLGLLFEDDDVRLAVERIDRKFEGTANLEILVDSGRENGLHEPGVLRRIEATVAYAQSLRSGPVRIGSSVSIVDIVKEINRALHEDRPEHYSLPDDRRLIAQELLLFENSGSDDLQDVTDSRFQEARVTLRANWTDAIFYVPFLQELEAGAREILGDELELEITGGMALSARTFQLVITSLARSYGLALLVITPLMILLIGNFRRGLLAMIPNLIPVYLTLALMGWLGITMNMSTLLIGSMVIGVAVDDTIHFMHKFNRYFQTSGDAAEAVRLTFDTTGTALLVTTIVLAASFAVFVLGHFNGTVHFGILACFATLVAFLADVLVAPALMVLACGNGNRA